VPLREDSGMADPRLRAHLVELGAHDDQLAGLSNDDMIGLAGDLRFAEGLDLDLAAVARTVGCDPEEVRRIYGWMGLRVEDLAGFGDDDVTLLRTVTGDTSGMVDIVGPQLLRVSGIALSRLAEAMVAAYVQDVEHHDRGAIDLVAEADQNALGATLSLALGGALPTVFRHHMWTAIRRQRKAQSGVAEPEVVRLAIGFVDLVGFTSLSRFASAGELIATIERFEQRAFDVAMRCGGRIVKSIGDEVMIAASDAETVASIALELIANTETDPAVAPRGGVSAGDVLFRLGDYYGSVVNLASRLTGEAVPGEVLTDQPLEDSSDLAVQPAGRRILKGFDEPVTVWSIDVRR
jgi:adenylate cyclase